MKWESPRKGWRRMTLGLQFVAMTVCAVLMVLEEHFPVRAVLAMAMGVLILTIVGVGVQPDWEPPFEEGDLVRFRKDDGTYVRGEVVACRVDTMLLTRVTGLDFEKGEAPEFKYDGFELDVDRMPGGPA